MTKIDARAVREESRGPRARVGLACVVLSLACACSGGEAPAPTPPPPPTSAGAPSATPPPSAPSPAPPTTAPLATPPPASEASATPTAPAEDTPEGVYAAMRAAFGRGDEAAYVAGMGDPFVCFFGRAGVPRGDVVSDRRAALAHAREVAGTEYPVRIESMALRRVRASDAEVELVDFGWTGGGGWDPATVFHRKRLLFRREGETWRLVGEGPQVGAACDLPPVDAEPPREWTILRDEFRALHEQCEGPPGSTMDDGYPGIGGSNGCMPEMNIMPTDFCGEHPSQACLDQTLPLLDAFLGEGSFSHDPADY